MRRKKKLVLAVCGIFSMVSSESNSKAENEKIFEDALSNAPLVAGSMNINKPSKDGQEFVDGIKTLPSLDLDEEQLDGSGKDGSRVTNNKSGSIERKNSKDGQQVIERENSSSSLSSNKDGSSSTNKDGASILSDPQYKCEWTGPAKVIESTCDSKVKKYCVGAVECLEAGSSLPFVSDASCLVSSNPKDGGVDDCSAGSASDCANSDSGIGTEDCNIRYHTSDEKSGAVDTGSDKSGGVDSQ